MNYLGALYKSDEYRELHNLSPLIRTPKKTNVSRLRTRIWIDKLLKDNDISISDIANLFYGSRESTGTIKRWISGRNTASKQSVNRLASFFPGSDTIYNHPVFELLDLYLKRNRLNELFSDFLIEDCIWDIPDTTLNLIKLPNYIIKDDVESLYHRNDICGFLCILMLLRDAEFTDDVVQHELYLKYTYLSLINFCRDPLFQKYWKEFFEAVRSLHLQLYSSMRLVLPLEKIFEFYVFTEDKRLPDEIFYTLNQIINDPNIDYPPPFAEARFDI